MIAEHYTQNVQSWQFHCFKSKIIRIGTKFQNRDHNLENGPYRDHAYKEGQLWPHWIWYDASSRDLFHACVSTSRDLRNFWCFKASCTKKLFDPCWDRRPVMKYVKQLHQCHSSSIQSFELLFSNDDHVILRTESQKPVQWGIFVKAWFKKSQECT